MTFSVNPFQGSLFVLVLEKKKNFCHRMTFSVNCFQGSLFVLVWLGSKPSHWALWVGRQRSHHPGDQGPVLAKCVDHRLSHQTTLLCWRPHGLYRILLLRWDWQIQSVWKWSCEWRVGLFVCVCVWNSVAIHSKYLSTHSALEYE